MKLIKSLDISPLWLFIIVFAFGIDCVIASATNKNTTCSKVYGKNGSDTENLNGNGSISQQTIQSLSTKPLDKHFPSTKADTKNSCKCGIASSASGKIVGGTPVNEDRYWPWFAALVRADRSTKVHCGGSLISRRYILTAAHCLLPMIQVGLRNFKVRLGDNELYGEQGSGNEAKPTNIQHDRLEVPIESVTVHPQYEQSFPYHHDIGLVKLSYAINCTNRVRPICLPSEDYSEKMYANETVITTGFGRTEINGNQSRVLQEIQLKIILINECRKQYATLPFKAPELQDNMICAWGKGKDPCVGDSGGPLFLWRKAQHDTSLGNSETSYFEQVGVTSWGVGCANEKYAGVYSRVGKFLPWLLSVLH